MVAYDLDLDIDLDLEGLEDLDEDLEERLRRALESVRGALVFSGGNVVVEHSSEDDPCVVRVEEDGDYKEVHVECHAETVGPRVIKLDRGHEVRTLLETPDDSV